MASRRDHLLQQLGITQWALRYPARLRGEIAVAISAETKLLIVSQQTLSPDDLLLCDVLRALSLTPEQAVILTPDQFAMLEQPTSLAYWWLGEDYPSDIEHLLHSPTLTRLYQDPVAKCALWQQICYDQDYLFPDRC